MTIRDFDKPQPPIDLQEVPIEALAGHLKSGCSFLDVRAPVEFKQASLPGAVNIPLLDDRERHEIGISYKRQGQAAAIELGHRLVSDEVRDLRLGKWLNFFRSHPQAILYCFRGGLRSATVQQWLASAGLRVTRLRGGYKTARRYFLQILDEIPPQLSMLTLTGHTGAGKTRLLRKWQTLQSKFSILDLEFLAHHRGSAFGQEIEPQPTAGDFENHLAVELLKCDGRPLIVEDEGRTIGQVAIPTQLFERLSLAPLIVINESIESRAQVILEDYVIERAEKLKKLNKDQYLPILSKQLRDPIVRISRKLGSARTAEVLELLETALAANAVELQNQGFSTWSRHLPWIIYLLQHYYDPYYTRHIESQTARVKLQGTRAELSRHLDTMSFV